MTTETLTLTDFLLARIAEDEATNGCNGEGEYGTCGQRSERIDRECEAKRRIVEWYMALRSDARDYDRDTLEAYWDAIQSLAAVYADHPDYSDDWRP